MNIEVWSPTIRRKEMTAVLTALVDEKIGPGDGSAQFTAFAKEKIGFEYCLALRSPAIALHQALKMLNLSPGDGVLVSGLSPVYYSIVLAGLGLKPVFADVSEVSACIEAETLEKVAEPYKAIVLHHPLGLLADTGVFADAGVPLIEDISTAFGSRFEAAAGSGTDGDEGKSGYEEKAMLPAAFTILGLEERDMITAGGGALLYAGERRNATVLRNTGGLPPEYALPDMNAVMAAVQMRECEKNIEKRREIAGLYGQSALRGRHRLFALPDNFVYNHYAFGIVIETGMKAVKQYAAKHGVAVESAFENTLAGAEMVNAETCPHCRSLSLRTALFPLYPRLGAKNAEKVAKVITTLP
ncbi:MAG: DegT/DnrJ/EryC1/StrS family aminotransferase [Spirochaetaceae bacterium]|jgi:dTDP-4-amino-4,6-dideoxygalactose transaminase|nr:DegT/DnrJ/EryC1/StrS family aminotransferase [Spirochaetaceae bacterium]